MSLPDPRLRIADSDRERAMADLSLHYTDGRLDHEEYDERLDAVWTARTYADLAVLFTDLPRPEANKPQVRAVQRHERGHQRGHGRFPLVPVVAVLIVLSAILGAHLWLLIFPLIYIRSRQGRGFHQPHSRQEYRRADRSRGW